MGYTPIEDLDVYIRSRALSNRIYSLVESWPPLAVQTFGHQLIRSADSISANLVEGDGRRSDADSVRFFIYSRASARETRHWIRVAADRGKIEGEIHDALLDELTEIAKMIQGIIRARTKSVVNEERATYGDSDPFLPTNDPTT